MMVRKNTDLLFRSSVRLYALTHVFEVEFFGSSAD